jgi:hypothetical protein
MLHSNRLDEKYMERKLDKYSVEFREQFEALKGSNLSKCRSITDRDYFILGEKLNRFNTMVKGLNESSVNQLGILPKIALDVITVDYGTSPMSLIASEQPIEEEVGIIYYRNVRAKSTRGNATAGEVLVSPKDPAVSKTLKDYAASGKTAVIGAVGDGTDKTFTIDLQGPIKYESFSVIVESAPSVKGSDYGDGFVYGYGVEGTIDNATGIVNLEFKTAPGAGKKIYVAYIENLEANADISQVEMFLDHTIIQAEPYALKGTIGLFENYGLSKKLGLNGAAELESMIITELNKELAGKAIKLLDGAAKGAATFDLRRANLRDGVSYAEHKEELKDAMASLDTTILDNAKRGNVNVYVAGARAAEVLGTMRGATKISTNKTYGPHLFCTLEDGTPVIRVPDQALLDKHRIIGLHKGDVLDAALVRSTYMPLVTTGLIPLGPNPLTEQNCVASWEGLKIVQSGFIAKLDLTMDAI